MILEEVMTTVEQLLLALLLVAIAWCHPLSTPVPVTLRHDEIGDCLWGTQVRKRCQDCAVLTKSSKAYRMCCFDDPGNSTESVRAYCERLLDYTVR